MVRDELEARGLLDSHQAKLMRSINQPGPPAPERIQWVEARGRAFSFTLQAGLPLLEAARRGFAAEGFAGGMLNIRGGALGPFAYVMPALSKTGENAAFYSDTFRPAGVTRLKLGAMTLGERDDAPFFHCHALWREADGRGSGGHILPEETVVAEPFEVEAFGIDGAVFTAEPDPETRFKLFGPVPTCGYRSARRPAAPSRCGCGRTRILPARWKRFCRAARDLARPSFTAASARPSARASPMAAASSRSRPNSRSAPAAIAPGADGTLEAELDVALVDYTRRPRRGPAGARRQSRADDDGTGAGSAGRAGEGVGGALAARCSD